MRTPHLLTTASLAALIALLGGCASTPKERGTDTDTPVEASAAEAAEPDLVAQLRERMAAGTLQRQEKPEEKKPAEAAEDTSRSPTVTADAGKQQAVAVVAGDYAKAMGMMANGQDDEALALLQKVAEKAPQLSGPLVNQAVILLKQKKYADAEARLQQALPINTRNPYTYNLLGISLREQGKFADARNAYEEALKLDPNYAKVHFNLGVLADLYLHDLPYALTHYERYQSLQSKPDPAVANWIVDLQRRTGTYKPPARPAPPPETVEETTTEETTTEGASTEEVPADPAADSAAAPAKENTP
ncbi:MAG: tetratricopeptide repeat protein [Moraxellaceae bacterium]|nr:tetratricopeptide repeat protein [Moraxellaceae bacterium]